MIDETETPALPETQSKGPPAPRALMFQGTGSDVGKSLIVALLARAARKRGLAVAPFKPQNMSNNAAACADGGEIGRAQALQARAAGLEPEVDFNPVLIKPETDRTAQIIVHGKPVGRLGARSFMADRGSLLTPVLESFERLASRFDLILVEGAGSASEVNLRKGDIANMGFARAAGVPVCLIGDIDRGGVIASLVGTKTVLPPEDAGHILGFLINRFRGDPTLFADGLLTIEERTGWRGFGVLPWLKSAANLPAEDAVILERSAPARSDKRLAIRAPMLSRIANFDDADPLRQEPGVDFAFVPPGRPIPRECDVILLMGTKSTLGDLAFLRAQGWDHDIIAHARSGGRVLGLCGGYQMLGQRIIDPQGHDGKAGAAEGLGLLQIETQMHGDKSVRPSEGRCAITGAPVAGYEIHAGLTTGSDCTRPMLMIGEQREGARSPDGRIEGCYLHGLFSRDAYRAAWLERAQPGSSSPLAFEAAVEATLDGLVEEMEAAINVDALLSAAKPLGWQP